MKKQESDSFRYEVIEDGNAIKADVSLGGDDAVGVVSTEQPALPLSSSMWHFQNGLGSFHNFQFTRRMMHRQNRIISFIADKSLSFRVSMLFVHLGPFRSKISARRRLSKLS
jgi:hypothetical protein